MEKSIEGLQHGAVQLKVGMGPKLQQDGTWVYSPIGAEVSMVGLDGIRVYITRRQKMVAQYIANCTIMDLCLAGSGSQE